MYGSIESKSLFLPITVHGQKQIAEVEALIDSGSMECLVSPALAEQTSMTLIPLQQPIILRNADKSENSQGKITLFVVLQYLWNGAVKMQFQKAYVVLISKHNVILGFQHVYRLVDVVKKTGSSSASVLGMSDA